MTSPFDGLQEHAEKIKECAWAFQQAIECHITDQCDSFEEFRLEVDRLESEADAIKRRIRGHLPKGTLMPVDKFELFRYLHEQDKVLDAVEEGLDLSPDSLQTSREVLEARIGNGDLHARPHDPAQGTARQRTGTHGGGDGTTGSQGTAGGYGQTSDSALPAASISITHPWAGDPAGGCGRGAGVLRDRRQ